MRTTAPDEAGNLGAANDIGIPGMDDVIIDVPNDLAARTKHITQQRQEVIQRLFQHSKNGEPNTDTEPVKSLTRKLTIFMHWLDRSVVMTPEWKTKTKN